MSNEAVKVQFGGGKIRARRRRSWSLSPAIRRDKTGASVSNGVRCTLNRRASIVHEAAFGSRRGTTCGDSSLLGELSELPGSPDVFRPFKELTSPALLRQDVPSSLPPQPRTWPCLFQGSSDFRCSTPSRDATTRTDVLKTPHQCTKPEDARLYYSLKDALRILPDEPPETGTRYALDQSSGCINQPHSLLSKDKHSVGEKTSGTKACEHGPVQSQSYERYKWESRVTSEVPNPGKHQTRRLVKAVVPLVSKSLRLLHSGLFKGSGKASKQELHPQTRHSSDPGISSASVVEPSIVGGLYQPGELNPLPLQTNGWSKDLYNGGILPVKRLSIKNKFGPTLAQSIEETLASLNLSNAEPAGSPTSGSYQRLLNSSRSLGSPQPTSGVVQFRTPLRKSRPAQLRIEIPSNPFWSSALTSNELDSSRTQPPRPSSRKQEDLRLTLRGGCFSSPKERPERLRYRIDPSQRPADDVLVPSRLWYLAGGRRVLEDRPGKTCHHRQPKSERGIQNPQPNRDPCEPLTFGDLRQWKRRSRPSDRLNPETGRMDPVYRSYWPEFMYQVSRGKMANMRTSEQQAKNQFHCPPGSGIPGPKDFLMPDPQGYEMPVNAGRQMYDSGGSGGYGGNLGDDPEAGLAQPQYTQPQYAQSQFAQPRYTQLHYPQPQYKMSGGLGPGSGAPYAGWR